MDLRQVDSIQTAAAEVTNARTQPHLIFYGIESCLCLAPEAKVERKTGLAIY